MFSQINDMGISLDSARDVILENDLPLIIRDYEAMRNGEKLSPLSWLVDREKLVTRDNTLLGINFKPRKTKSSFALARVGDLCRVVRGISSSTKTEPGKYKLVVRGEEMLTSQNYHFKGKAVCVPLLSLAHGRGQIKRVHFVAGKFAVANLLAVLQPHDLKKLDARYLYLAIDKDKDELASLMQGSVYVTLKIDDLENFEIPLPPIKIQRALAKKHTALQSFIANNKKLTTRMEQKIQAALASIWGES